MADKKKRIGFVVGNYHTDHPIRLVHMIWHLQALSQRIKTACDAYNAHSNRPYYLEISVVCATGTVQRREEWESLAAKADEALYAAKKNRRAFVVR